MKPSIRIFLLLAFFAGFLPVSSGAQTLPSQKPKAALFNPKQAAELETFRRQVSGTPVRPGVQSNLPSAVPDPGKKFRTKANTGAPAQGGTQGKLPSTANRDSMSFLRSKMPR